MHDADIGSPKRPQGMRVISLLASGTEIVCALGAQDMLVGRSHECDSPPSVIALPQCTGPAFDTDGTSGDIDREVKRMRRVAGPNFDATAARARRLI